VGAEEDRNADVSRRRFQAREHVPVVVALDANPEVGQVAAHALGDRPLLPGRARERGQLEEERKGVGAGAQRIPVSRAAFAARPGAGTTRLIERGESVYIGVGTVIFIILLVLLILYLT
jgi:hypothetical protein